MKTLHGTIHGDLHEVGAGRLIAIGRISGDTKRRWPDGTLIQTSLVTSGPDPDGIIETMNSRYQLVDVGE